MKSVVIVLLVMGIVGLPVMAAEDAAGSRGTRDRTVGTRDRTVVENLPALLVGSSGKRIRGVAGWEVRRAELVRMFSEEEYGVRPVERPEGLTFTALEPDCEMMSGTAIRKRVKATWKGLYGSGGFTFTAFLPKGRKSPAFLLICNRGLENIDPTREKKSSFWPAEEIVRRGYAALAFHYEEIAPDDKSPIFTNGVYTCFSPQGVRTETSWGAISAWAWGASRVMDWIETEPMLDAAHVAVVGHSRGGKTALWAGVTDTRFAMACVNDSGCSGAKLNHVSLPESESIAIITKAFPHWFCKRYDKYAGREREMTFDQHQLVALMAPRLVAIASATEDRWAGPEGEWLSANLASPVWRLYGLDGLKEGEVKGQRSEVKGQRSEVKGQRSEVEGTEKASGEKRKRRKKVKFPAPDTAQQGGCVSYHLRAGKHDLTEHDWARYMDFADRNGWRN